MSGIFGLSAYNDRNLSGLIPDKTRETYREYGYFGGGYAPGNVSIVDRVDYSNDTATASRRGPLAQAAHFLTAAGNTNFGYYSAFSSFLSRINYSNDSAVASIRGNLSRGNDHLNMGATGNSNYGYWGGGGFFVQPQVSRIDRFDYSNDLNQSLIRSTFTVARTTVATTTNSNFGYWGGGYIAPATVSSTRVDRLNYSNDVATASIRGSLSQNASSAAAGNPNFGYFGGGGVTSQLSRITYSNDTATASFRISSFLGDTATGNSNFGYFTGATGIILTRIDYSNDTTIPSVRGSITLSRRSLAATSSASFGGAPNSQYGVFPKPFGYFGGGRFPAIGASSSAIQRIDYASDTTVANVRTFLNQLTSHASGIGNDKFGYFAGKVPATSAIDRINYSNDTQSTTRVSNLNREKGSMGAVGNYNFGYFGGGGAFPFTYSDIVRLDYSNDLNLLSLRSNLSSNTDTLSATGNLNFGYFGGGSGPISRVDRINYSSDTSSVSTRGPLSSSRYRLSASGNNNFGYFAGGLSATQLSSVDRIDYSNDTATASVRGPLAITLQDLTSTGNSNFGYFGTGLSSPSVFYDSRLCRVDYSNDTGTASFRSLLNLPYSSVGATSPLTPSSAFALGQYPNVGLSTYADYQPTSTFFNIQSMRRTEDTTNASVKKRVLGSYGYFAGAFPGGSIVDRIDFSNDLATASVRGSLSPGSSEMGASSNSNFGYFCGGEFLFSLVRRIDFSNDLALTTTRGNLSSARRRVGGVGNLNYGYMIGGSDPNTRIDRIDYSNDNATASIRGSSVEVLFAAATGNSNFGYYLSSGGSFTQRLTYANDLVSSSRRASLLYSYSSRGAVGNSNFGYFCGGVIGSPFETYSNVDRINYSNDTATAISRGQLLVSRGTVGTGNQNFGYLNSSAPSSIVISRIDYSNDTAIASVRGPLSAARYSLSATSNASNP